MVFRRQNHVTFIFIKTMSHDLLVQVACLNWNTNDVVEFVVVFFSLRRQGDFIFHASLMYQQCNSVGSFLNFNPKVLC